MAQTANQISLYRKMTENMAKAAGMIIPTPLFKYDTEVGEKSLEIPKDFFGVLKVNDIDSFWSPEENNLILTQHFEFKHPSILYGKNGITMKGNKIGMAVHIHSRTSNYQETRDVGTISNVDYPIKVSFVKVFPASTIRGVIDLDFFLYLKEYESHNPIQASKAGMILSEGDIANLTIVADGDGSSFPMSEFEDPNGPLWRLEKHWVEANIDTFDSSNINLSLNTKHKLFEQIKNGQRSISRAMMGDIMVQAMSAIIQEVVIVEKISLEDTDALPDSILASVQYWVNTFEIDISSIFSISNSMREYWDKEMIEGGSDND